MGDKAPKDKAKQKKIVEKKGAKAAKPAPSAAAAPAAKGNKK